MCPTATSQHSPLASLLLDWSPCPHLPLSPSGLPQPYLLFIHVNPLWAGRYLCQKSFRDSPLQISNFPALISIVPHTYSTFQPYLLLYSHVLHISAAWSTCNSQDPLHFPCGPFCKLPPLSNSSLAIAVLLIIPELGQVPTVQICFLILLLNSILPLLHCLPYVNSALSFIYPYLCTYLSCLRLFLKHLWHVKGMHWALCMCYLT